MIYITLAFRCCCGRRSEDPTKLKSVSLRQEEELWSRSHLRAKVRLKKGQKHCCLLKTFPNVYVEFDREIFLSICFRFSSKIGLIVIFYQF